VRQAADATRADVVVVVGLNVLPWLGAIAGPVRAWYAADEWFWHHTSMIRPLRPKTWRELKPAIIKGWYERSFASMIDRAWVVSEADRRAMRWVAGIDTIDVIPNGVDSKWYSPTEGAVIPRSCVFWGRLDFGPNIQAIEWFCRSVWPLVRRRVPDATLSIFGFQPAPVIERIAGNYGVELFPNLPDIRAEVQRRAVAVLPFVSGGGIKNKLLEACALGMTVVCTPRSRSGLRGRDLPLIVASKPREWVERLVELWENDGSRRATAARARAWVVENHSWESAARIARDGAALHRMKIGAP
jgi:glycosyltransferase involved in cell wall biosynthesis